MAGIGSLIGCTNRAPNLAKPAGLNWGTYRVKNDEVSVGCPKPSCGRPDVAGAGRAGVRRRQHARVLSSTVDTERRDCRSYGVQATRSCRGQNALGDGRRVPDRWGRKRKRSFRRSAPLSRKRSDRRGRQKCCDAREFAIYLRDSLFDRMKFAREAPSAGHDVVFTSRRHAWVPR